MVHQRIRGEIDKAESLFAFHGEVMALDAGIRSLVTGYREAISETGEAMNGMGVVEACTVCAARCRDGCCFMGIEDGYDHILLMVNLLLGGSLPHHGELPGCCYFVGSKGCTLIARYYFCLHYFCPDLMKSLGSARVTTLLATVGIELSIGWRLEKAVRDWLLRT